MSCKHPCPACPWRTENQSKRHFGSFFTKANLARLWNGIRRGNAMSCHLTDPSHPDHVKAGAAPNAEPQECPGSVILVMRELRAMASDGNIGAPELERYKRERPRGLVAHGLRYWLVERVTMGGVPFLGGPKLPHVDVDEPGVALPEHLNPARGAR